MDESRLEYDAVGGLTQQSVSALVARVSSSSPASPSEPSDAGTSSVLYGRASPVPQLLTADQAAFAWIDHVQGGGAVPDGATFVGLLHALLASRAPHPLVPMPPRAADDLDVQMIIVNTEPKFPHMRETENGKLAYSDAIWTQCKTKMTHIAVRLVDMNGQPVEGKDVQPGGLKLRLTLHKVSEDAPMDDYHNPRPHEGLFLGRASKVFEPEVILIRESRHEFRFQVLLLSSDIGGARMFVKVAPVDPQLALNPNLTVQSHSFASRARMPDEYATSRAKRTAAAAHLLTMALTMAEAQESELSTESAETDTRASSPPNKRACSPKAPEPPPPPPPP